MGLRQKIAGLFRKNPTTPSDRTQARASGEEVAVIGLGSFGRSLALRLSELGFTVLGIDHDATIVQAIADDLTSAVVMDATNEDALRQADIESYDTAVVSIGGDHFEATAVTTISLAKIGIPHIIALANTNRQVEILQAIGATRVLNPIQGSARSLADELVDPGRGDAWPLPTGHQLAVIPVAESLVGKPVQSLDGQGVSVLAVTRGTTAIPRPEPSLVLGPDDSLVVLGEPPAILNLRRLA